MRRSRYAALILLLVILAGTILPCYSQAVVAEAILITGVVSVTLGLVLDLLTVCMGSSAMDGALRNQARSMSISPRQRLAQIYSDWRDARDKTMDDVAAIVQRGLHYGDSGDLYLDAELADTVTDVLGYAWTDQDLEGYAPVGSPGDGLYSNGDLTVALVTCNTPISTSTTTYYYDPSAYLIITSGSYANDHLTIASKYPGAQYYVVFQRSSSSGGYLLGAPANLYSTSYVVLSGSSLVSGNTYDDASPLTLRRLVSYSVTDGNIIPIYRGNTALSGYVIDPVAFGVTPAASGDPSHLDTGTGVQLQISQAATLTTDVVDPDTRQRILVNNWISAIARYYDQVAGTAADGATVGEAVDIPVYDDTGEQIGVGSLSIPLDTAVPVTGVSDATISQDATAATDVIAADQAGLDDLTLDLTAYFPFCVPFDIYRIFSMWDATAEAPVIEWRVLVPQLNVDLPLTIDLSPFDDVAALLRQLEVIAFAVGLAVMTKRLIQGGD